MTKRIAVVVFFLLAAAANARAQGADIQIERASQPPKIDGVLDDEVWKRAPLPAADWVSYQPVRGDKMPDVFRTETRVTYDDRNIYLAFHCFDNEPSKIRTNVSRRDSAFNDDWIAMSLDSAGTPAFVSTLRARVTLRSRPRAARKRGAAGNSTSAATSSRLPVCKSCGG